ncbi:hypothetical protein ELP91_28755, partial [Klebsiella pneumoniae]|nr:hypothetical protein [Klebsiella pneumoniae]
KWSRQSEELPLHRVIDLAKLICIAMDYSKHVRLSYSDDFPVSRSGGNPELSRNIDLKKNEIKDNHEHLDLTLIHISRCRR